MSNVATHGRARRPKRQLLFLWAGLIMLRGNASAQTAHLQFAERPMLLNCGLPSSPPCFRLELNLVDEGGNPVTCELAENRKLAAATSVFVHGERISPFYAAPPGGESGAARRGRITLILIDDSGSMSKLVGRGETRFQAAKAAAIQFLHDFDDGIDRVAIVPFESHGVLETIEQATFARSSQEARRQIERLRAPESRNNTALFSAIDAGLDAFKGQARAAGGSVDGVLIVLTDGKNDVGHPGDDAGLLGSPALESVRRKVAETSGVQVIAVGFGNTSDGEMDEETLKAITPDHYYQASGAQELMHVFRAARFLQTNRIQVTFKSPAPDRASLAGRNLSMRASLRLPGGETVESNTITWSPPSMGIVPYDENCGSEEKKALAEALLNGSETGQSPWVAMLRPVLVFVGLGAVLLTLWFWVPRLIWADQYVGEFQTARIAGRWAGEAGEMSSLSSPGGRPTPPASREGARVPAPPRTPADATRVLPVNMTGTRAARRTRLDMKATSDEDR